MKKARYLFRWMMVLALLVLFNVTQADTVMANTKKDAVKLTVEQNHKGSVRTMDEEKWYRIPLKSSGRLTIAVTAKQADPVLQLYDSKDHRLPSLNAPVKINGTMKYIYELKKGTYYCSVKAAGGSVVSQTEISYTLKTNFVSAKADFETNNTWKRAKKLPEKWEIRGHLAQNAPEEYFCMAVNNITEYEFILLAKEKLRISLFDQDGTEIGFNEIYGDGYGYTYLPAKLCSGKYYLKIFSLEYDGGERCHKAGLGEFKLRAYRRTHQMSLKISEEEVEYTGKVLKPEKVVLKRANGEVVDPDRYRIRFVDAFTGEIYGEDSGVWNVGCYMATIDTKGTYDEYFTESEIHEMYELFAYFTIKPVQGKIRRLKNIAGNGLQIEAEKAKQVSGYQIEIAQDRKFKKNKKVVNIEKTKFSLRGVTAGKKYYVRLRNYSKFIPSDHAWHNIIYGKWSETRTIVIK